MHKVQDNDIIRDATPEEVAQMEKDAAAAIENRNAKIAEANALKANQASGNQKLLDLGLTQAEATALTGYKPPEEEE